MPVKPLLAILLAAAFPVLAEPVRVIFDTDMGNDVDDALALAMLHALEKRHECRLVAVTLTKDNRWAAPFVDLVNTFYRRAYIPVGAIRNGKTPGDSKMLLDPCRRKAADGSWLYPRRIDSGTETPDSVELLKRVLNEQPDGAVVVIQVGFSTNLARLIASPGGKPLVARKVRLLSAMAGNFQEAKPEYNVQQDIPSAKVVFQQWPSPVVFSGWEIGAQLLFPATAVEQGFAWAPFHPVADAYRAYKKMPYDRPSWDLTSVLYAVRPSGRYFSLSPAGRVLVDERGVTRFREEPGGPHRYLILDPAQKARTLEALVELATQPR